MMTTTPTQDLIIKLNTRAVKAPREKFRSIEIMLHAKNGQLRKEIVSGWYYSWHVCRVNPETSLFTTPLHESLHAEADDLLEQMSRQNGEVILVSAYVAAMVTYTDSCRTMLHHYLPPFLHPTLTAMGIGSDPNTEPYPFPLSDLEQHGKEILYSYALLEMTGT